MIHITLSRRLYIPSLCAVCFQELSFDASIYKAPILTIWSCNLFRAVITGKKSKKLDLMFL